VREDSDLDLADDLAVTDLEDDERFFIDAIWYDDNDLEFNEIVQARM
jgi:hypothetical protein